MTYEDIGEIISLVKKFEDCSLPNQEWTHAAHLTVAFWYCLHHDLETVIARMREGILNLNEAHGTPNTETRGYHETLTVFWVYTVWNFLEDSVNEISLVVLVNKLIAAYTDSLLPLEWYSRETLFSPEARKRYVSPTFRSCERFEWETV